MHKLIAHFRRLQTDAADAGMSTVEYAMGLLAAVALAGVLYKVLTSPSVQAALNAIIGRALK